jgi:pilus assembly protein Flp/PilA
LRKALIRFARHETGATAIEYGLVCTGVGIAVLGAFRLYGSTLVDLFPRIFELFKFE